MSSDPFTAFTRREFLSTGLVMASAAVTIPYFLNRSALGMPMPEWGATSIPGVPEDHVLVVVQLGGGNDGLNMVVPYGETAYYRAPVVPRFRSARIRFRRRSPRLRRSRDRRLETYSSWPWPALPGSCSIPSIGSCIGGFAGSPGVSTLRATVPSGLAYQPGSA